ncbi:hypothetical protein [Sphingobium sp. HWE2-09]|uniref:hypothetical protein n=1 Tax=Sphingobium sp. HWE2-09 TaxID=3108390 RepID=UPI002DD213AF|nr:hypothetical protein [Sphingobium sp. HWE2-09]
MLSRSILILFIYRLFARNRSNKKKDVRDEATVRAERRSLDMPDHGMGKGVGKRNDAFGMMVSACWPASTTCDECGGNGGASRMGAAAPMVAQSSMAARPT